MAVDYNELEEEVYQLYKEPPIGASYINTYGEENIKNLVDKYRSLSLEQEKKDHMLQMIVTYSKTQDLSSSFVSVGVLHALGKAREVEEAYQWAHQWEESHLFISHFDIGKSLGDYFCKE